MDELKKKSEKIPEFTNVLNGIDAELSKLQDNVHGVIEHATVLMGYNEESRIEEGPDTSNCFMSSLTNKKEVLVVLNSRLHEVLEALKKVV